MEGAHARSTEREHSRSALARRRRIYETVIFRKLQAGNSRCRVRARVLAADLWVAAVPLALAPLILPLLHERPRACDRIAAEALRKKLLNLAGVGLFVTFYFVDDKSSGGPRSEGMSLDGTILHLLWARKLLVSNVMNIRVC